MSSSNEKHQKSSKRMAILIPKSQSAPTSPNISPRNTLQKNKSDPGTPIIGVRSKHKTTTPFEWVVPELSTIFDNQITEETKRRNQTKHKLVSLTGRSSTVIQKALIHAKRGVLDSSVNQDPCITFDD